MSPQSHVLFDAPGPGARRGNNILTLLATAAMLGVAGQADSFLDRVIAGARTAGRRHSRRRGSSRSRSQSPMKPMPRTNAAISSAATEAPTSLGRR